jgi:protein-S-isoprenylcysteine O-methyltransferase Ste14
MAWLIGRHVPRWWGVVSHALAFPAVHGVVPWALSLLGVRHGWASGLPGPYNLVGLIPVAAGFYTVFLCMREHVAAAPNGWLLEKTPHFTTPSYLLTEGPYRYSCNPIYVSEGVIWLGWLAFFGTFVLAGVAVLALVLGPIIVPREERGLEARFGGAYRDHRLTTPRWFGKARR